MGLNLPYGSYLRWLGRYPLRHTHQVVFDHLGPPTSFYLSKGELEDWSSGEDRRLLSLSQRNGNSWRVLVERGFMVRDPRGSP